MDFLVLGTLDDPHVARVSKALDSRGLVCECLDYNNPSTEITLLQHPGNDEIAILINGSRVGKGTLIWNRLKLYVGSPFYFRQDIESENINAKRAQEFRANEWRAMCQLIMNVYAKNVINNPFTIGHMNKVFQQAVANYIGLPIPKTIVTNVKEDAETFVKMSDGVISKCFSGGQVAAKRGEYPEYYGLMTMPISISDIKNAKVEQIRSCPHLFQTEIKKKYELRIVIVGDEIFAFRINSQDKAYTVHDWRYGNYTLKFELVDIPHDIADQLFSFMKL